MSSTLAPSGLVLTFMGITIAICFLDVPVANQSIHLLMATTLAMTVHLRDLIIADLAHRSYRVWNQKRTPFDNPMKRLQQ